MALIVLREYRLFGEVLADHAEQKPDETAFSFRRADGSPEGVTYRLLREKANSVAAALTENPEENGNVLLLFPPGLEFIEGFLGCASAGLAAVPLSMPGRRQSFDAIRAIAQDCSARVALCTESSRDQILERLPENDPLRSLTWMPVDRLDAVAGRGPGNGPRHPGDPILLQYTSGSTGQPKGVAVSHGNLLHNLHSMASLWRHTTESKFVSWLPHFHDMGLIGAILQSLYVGIECVLLSPAAFIQRPHLWLQTITAVRATASGGPNFAYDHCVARITDEQREGLDLTSWEIAWNGAETVRPSTISAFSRRFAAKGFSSKAFFPCYGLAEATLMATGGKRYSGAVIRVRDGNELVGCGKSLPGQSVKIVDPANLAPVADGAIGEIVIRGPSIARGYWNHGGATAESFDRRVDGEGGYLRTGDLGFLSAGELFVVGRTKETIILHGRNLYAHDLERTACRSHPALNEQAAAAFSVPGPEGEALVLVCEPSREQRSGLDGAAVAQAAACALADEYQVSLHDLAIIRPGTLPKTTSGKIKRLECRDFYLAKKLTLFFTTRSMPKEIDYATLNHEQLAGLAPSQQPAALVAYLKTVIAKIRKTDPLLVDSSQQIAKLGLASVDFVWFVLSIEEVTGLKIPMEPLDGPRTLQQIADNAVARMREAASSPS